MEAFLQYLTFPFLLEGMWLTLRIFAASMVGGLALGLLIALMRLSPYRLLSGLPLDRMEATVTFAPSDQGTAVSYEVSVEGPVGALPVNHPTRELINAFVRGATAEAERRDSAAS